MATNMKKDMLFKGALDFDFGMGVFRINAPQVKTASDNIKGKVELGKCCFEVKNEKMTLSLLSLDGKDTDESGHLLLVALGWCGNLDMLNHDGSGMKLLEANGALPLLLFLACLANTSVIVWERKGGLSQT